MTADKLKAILAGMDEEILLADGLEDAFLGVAWQFNQPMAVYDREQCIAIFMRQGMTYEGAEEHFGYNVAGAWVGKATPAFLVSMKALVEASGYDAPAGPPEAPPAAG